MANRGRPPKNKPVDQPSIPQIAPEQMITVNDINNRWNQLITNKMYQNCNVLDATVSAFKRSPYIRNDMLKQLKSQPGAIDRDQLEEALKSPAYNELGLRQQSWAIAQTIYPYKKMLKMYSDILSYNNYLYPKYLEEKDFKSEEYKKEEILVHKIKDRLDPKVTFRNIVWDCMYEGKRSYNLRWKVNKANSTCDMFYLQELPSDYIKYVSKSDDTPYITSFNFTYFWRPGADPADYGDQFVEYWHELNGCTLTGKDGNKAIDLTKITGIGGQTDGSKVVEYDGYNWFYWKELSQLECWCFGHEMITNWQLPPFVGLFINSSDLTNYSSLQQTLLSTPLYSMILATIPTMQDSKTGSYANQMAITPEYLEYFGNLFNGSAPQGTSLFAAPFENYQMVQFNHDVNNSTIFTNALQQWIGLSGTGGLISTTEKPSVSMVKSSQITEFRYADNFYGQFKHFMEVVLEKLVKTKFTWKFEIFGNEFTKNDDIKNAKEALAIGDRSSMAKYTACMNKDIFDAVSLIDQWESHGWFEKMIPVQSAFNSSSSATPKGDNGRTKIADEDIENESTATQRDAGDERETIE